MIQSLHELTLSMGIPVGGVVVDAGCGSGEVSIELATIVGPRGTVYAVDIDRMALQMVAARANRLGIHTIRPLACDLGRIDDSLAPSSVDAIIARSLLSMSDDPESLCIHFRHILKDTGRLVIIDWTSSIAGVIPDPRRIVSPDMISRFAQAAGMRNVFQKNVGDYHTMFILEPIVIH